MVTLTLTLRNKALKFKSEVLGGRDADYERIPREKKVQSKVFILLSQGRERARCGEMHQH